MTQEEKQLLLKDLCARLPYNLQIHYSIIEKSGYEVTKLYPEFITELQLNDDISIKPYLRPMSSMTEEERTDLRMYCGAQEGIMYNVGVVGAFHSPAIIDFLNSHHLDYRGLIEKGLALEAPKEMYNVKE